VSEFTSPGRFVTSRRRLRNARVQGLSAQLVQIFRVRQSGEASCRSFLPGERDATPQDSPTRNETALQVAQVEN